MSNKLLVRLAGALVVLILVWGGLALVRRPPEDRTVSLAIPKVDTASVDSIVFAKRADTTVLTRAGKQWKANGFAADSSTVGSLLSALADTARPTELVAENRSSHERLGVAPDSALHVTVRSRAGARPALDLFAGGRTSDYGGVFVRRPDGDAVYALRGTLFESLTRAPDDWRDKRIAQVAQDSVARIEIQRGIRSYALARSGKAWTLDGKPADSAAVASLLGDYHDLRASGFPSRAQADSIDFQKPKAATKMLSAKGTPLVALRFDSTASGMWARADSGGPVYKLDSWIWSRLAPAETTLAAKKPAKGEKKK